MANIFPAGPRDNEGSVSWSVVSGAATLSNSTDHAVTGTQALKAVCSNTSPIAVAIAYANRITCLASTSYTTTMHIRSSASRWCSAAIDWYTSGGTYISTDVLDGSANTTTGSWQTRVDVGTSPGTAGSFTLKFDFDNNTTSTNFYVDNITVDDGVSATTVGISPFIMMGLT